MQIKIGPFLRQPAVRSPRDNAPRHNSTATVRNRGPQGFDDDRVKDGHSFTDERGFQIHLQRDGTLDIEELSVKNLRRQDAATLYADLDGFTAHVTNNIASDNSAKHIVRTLHVLRSELDAVLHADVAGRKVRFIDDCVHGLAVEGTAQTTDDKETISNLTLCGAGMRSSFNLALLKLKENGTDTSSLGLQIGFEYGR